MSLIKVERKDLVQWIILNRPERLNALNRELMRKFVEELERSGKDPGVEIIVISGEGKIFSAGIDLQEIARAEKVEEVEDIFIHLERMFKTLLDVPKITILALNGDAYGGGAEMIWAADIVVSVEDAKIGWAEARWGLVPPIAIGLGSFVLGFSRAALTAYTAGSITAKEAYNLGLISVLTSRDRLRESVEEVANNILINTSPEARESIRNMIRLVKKSLFVEFGVSELKRLSKTGELIKRARDFIEKKQIPRYK
ncbi:MAG: enoyl-CoA hydratase/isomerase family protein [Desulfurococcales archaeon]|jgi:enoyl-CoA hydratase/carnithine racemase|nr:enoyl-CoA hydratase/isomerase family protein [Desulfurococcales archaeon]